MKTFFVLLVVMGGYLLVASEQRDNARQVVYDKCFEIARANALPIPEYLQECMD